MSPDDLRAVENPISAMFDLADKVSEEAPRVRKAVLYASFFIGFWLLLNFIFMLVFLRQNLIIGVFLLVMFILGAIGLASLRNLNDFFNYYSTRHTFIKSVRDADPVVLVPKGANAVDRLRSYLMARNPQMSSALAAAQSLAVLKGRSGVFYQFDVYVASRSSLLWKLAGRGYPGYQLFIKAFNSAPRTEDIIAVKRAVEDVAKETGMPVSRAIILWGRKAGEDLSEDAYNLINSATLLTKRMGRTYACSMELVVENEDGTYEFIPFIAESQPLSMPRAH